MALACTSCPTLAAAASSKARWGRRPRRRQRRRLQRNEFLNAVRIARMCRMTPPTPMCVCRLPRDRYVACTGVEATVLNAINCGNESTPRRACPRAAGAIPVAAADSADTIRKRRWRWTLRLASSASLVWGLLRWPAWASMAAPVTETASSVIAPAAQWRTRLANYSAISGSLASDLTLAILSFWVFACCAGTETAITTLWPWKVRELAQRESEEAAEEEKKEGGAMSGRKMAGVWTALRGDINRFMQTILLGATLSGVVSTAFMTEICGQVFGSNGLAIATLGVTLTQLILGEIVPKSMAVSSPYSFAKSVLPMFHGVSFWVYPLSRRLNHVVTSALGMFGISVDPNKTPYVSEEELNLIFKSAIKSGVLEEEEGAMITSVRNLDSKCVKEVMTPLVDMICIEASERLDALHEILLKTQYSRIPVYEERFDSIIGVTSMKTLLRCTHGSGDFEDRTVEEISDRPFFVPETMSLLTALRSLKERTLAICVNEYGGTVGLVTLEDVLEEIVGEIYDPDEEKDKLERAQNRSKIKQIGEGKFTMSATAEVEDVSAVLGIEIPDGNYNSIGGFMCNYIDRIPSAGEAVTLQTVRELVRFEVSEVEERRIVRILAECRQLGTEGDSTWEDSDEDADRDGEQDRSRVLYVRPETDEEATDVSTATVTVELPPPGSASLPRTEPAPDGASGDVRA